MVEGIYCNMEDRSTLAICGSHVESGDDPVVSKANNGATGGVGAPSDEGGQAVVIHPSKAVDHGTGRPG